jgi:hypothetical protein
MENNICVMLNYSRSGGTLLTRMIGMLPNIAIVSEINPQRGIDTNNVDIDASTAVRRQMLDWYGADLPEGDFVSTVVGAVSWSRERGRQFVLRDWTQIDYRHYPGNSRGPSGRLTVLDVLSKEFKITSFALVRDAIDVYISRKGEINSFAEEYNRYVRSLIEKQVRIFRYEDLVADPFNFMQELCRYCGWEYADSWRDYNSNFRCTGDIQLGMKSRGIRQAAIRPLRRKWLDTDERSAIEGCEPLMEANRLLDYPQSYSGAEVEGFAEMALRKLRNRLLKERRTAPGNAA